MSPWWFTLILWAVFFVASELLRPKQDIENAKPAGLGDFRFPTATEGRCVPVGWGTFKVEGPNVIWYGDVRNEAIREHVRTGVFSSQDIVIGHRYSVGLQFALCRGPVDRITKIWIDKHVVLSNDLTHGDRVWIDRPNLFGQPDAEQNEWDGVHGIVAMYEGNKTQEPNEYLSNFQDPDIGYRGTCYIIYEGGYHGNSPNIKPWSFEVVRIPDGLGLASVVAGAEAPNGHDANLANVIFEILTDTDWGLGESISKVDLDNFRQAGIQLADEGNGFSMLIDREMEVSELIKELSRQMDGTVYFDRAAGLWRIKLVRDDYDPDDLETFDESSISVLTDYARTTWDETSNQVRISYIEREDDYKDTYALAQDIGNYNTQGKHVTSDIRYPGVKVGSLANSLAWRDLKTLSYPLAKITFEINRKAFNLVPGSMFKFSWVTLGISGMVFRINKIKPGTIEEGKIEVFAVQDIFSTGVGVFASPSLTGWVSPHTEVAPVESEDTLVIEVGRQIVAQDPYSPGLEPRIFMGARNPGGGTAALHSYIRHGASRPLSGSFVQDATISAFLKCGTLETALPAYAASDTRPTTSYTIRVDKDPDDLTELAGTGNAGLVSDLRNIIYIDNEFIGFEIATDSGGLLILSRIYRGLFNTTPEAHLVGSRVWFVGQTGGNLNNSAIPVANVELDAQLRSVGMAGEATEASTPIMSITLESWWNRPLPPRDPVLNDSYAATTASLDTSHAGTGRTGEDARALKVEVTPRCWRIDDPIEDHALSASPRPYLEDNPSIVATLILDPSGSAIETEEATAVDPEEPVIYLLRNEVVKALGANTPMPSTAKLSVIHRHHPDGSSISDSRPLEHSISLSSGLIGDDLQHGGIDGGDVASTAVVYGETGNYTFNIHTALPSSGRLQARLNGGSWVNVVLAGNSSGTLAVTSGDSVELRFDHTPALDQFFNVNGPTQAGYGVLLA